METLVDVVQLDLVPLVSAALKEAARLTAAVEGVARELDHLTTELREGERTGCSARSSASSAAPTNGGNP